MDGWMDGLWACLLSPACFCWEEEDIPKLQHRQKQWLVGRTMLGSGRLLIFVNLENELPDLIIWSFHFYFFWFRSSASGSSDTGPTGCTFFTWIPFSSCSFPSFALVFAVFADNESACHVKDDRSGKLVLEHLCCNPKADCIGSISEIRGETDTPTGL